MSRMPRTSVYLSDTLMLHAGAVIGSYVQSMEARGVAPHYWMSNHVPGGHEYNDNVKEPFLQRGY
eukprot:COSAG01_NODE_3552_length_5942_cov_20.267842_6_plen_65_part_00